MSTLDTYKNIYSLACSLGRKGKKSPTISISQTVSGTGFPSVSTANIEIISQIILLMGGNAQTWHCRNWHASILSNQAMYVYKVLQKWILKIHDNVHEDAKQKEYFCYVVFNSQMFNATEVQL
jgi:hypothetical protein